MWLSARFSGRVAVGASSVRRCRRSRVMRARRPLMVVALVVLFTGLGGSSAAGRSTSVSYLDNGTISVGVDLDDGGTISFLARSRGVAADLLDAVQPAYGDGVWRVAAGGGTLLASPGTTGRRSTRRSSRARLTVRRVRACSRRG